MGAFIRIIARYALGYAAAKGLLPEGLLQELSTNPDVRMWVDGLTIGAAAIIVEGARRLALRYGWSL